MEQKELSMQMEVPYTLFWMKLTRVHVYKCQNSMTERAPLVLIAKSLLPDHSNSDMTINSGQNVKRH